MYESMFDFSKFQIFALFLSLRFSIQMLLKIITKSETSAKTKIEFCEKKEAKNVTAASL